MQFILKQKYLIKNKIIKIFSKFFKKKTFKKKNSDDIYPLW